MIKYTLECENEHRFESWFRDSAAYDTLAAAGHIACSVCGSDAVKKAIMAPTVRASEKSASKPAADHAPLSAPASPAEVALRELRAAVEKNADNVGREFAREARAIHNGEAPERAIYGEAKPDEARDLIEDGIPVAPLPWPNKSSN